MALCLLVLNSCVKDKFEEGLSPDSETEDEVSTDEIELTQLQIPDGFEFKTSEKVSVTINDNTPGAIYTVYAYNEAPFSVQEVTAINDDGEIETVSTFESDEYNQVLFTGAVTNGSLRNTITVPSYYNKLYLRRNHGGTFSSEIVDIAGGNVIYTHTDQTGKSRLAEVARFKSRALMRKAANNNIEIDTLYCVNGSGQLFTVNPLNGDLTDLAAMPQGSWTAAIDHTNLYLYSIGRNSPYPLMRYDMINDSWTTVGDVGMGGPRLDYREEDGLLYFSGNNAKVYTIDPSNGATISTWDINNLDVTNGGDLIFADDGTLYLSSFGGLYQLDLDENNDYNATRLSADNLPYTPTSMTIDSNDELWLASNGSNSDLIIMDTGTGGWEYIYGPNSDTDVDFGRTINDLTTYTVVDEDAEDPDTDGDGITDSNDEYPEDAEKAFEQFTPSKYGWGTVAFEDLWPFLGDYDFNDTAVNYRFVAILNAENKAVQLDIYYEVTSDGAGLTNGFGIEMETLVPSQIESVTGYKLTENYVTLAANGLEDNQDNAVVILFDDHGRQVNRPGLVSIEFTEPLTTQELGVAPFNPFLIVGKNRSKEIHLPNRSRTSLATLAVDDSINNVDTDGNYQTSTGLPWAIDIVHNFKPPKEKVPVNQAYNFFNDWATSGGALYDDWYKDNAGYRVTANLK